MFTLVAGLVLVLATEGDPAKELSDLSQGLVKTESYAFQIVIKDEGSGMGRFPGGERGGTPEPQKAAGKFQKGKPYYLKTDALEAFRMENEKDPSRSQTVYREPEKEWQLFDSQSFGGRFVRSGEGGRGERAEGREGVEEGRGREERGQGRRGEREGSEGERRAGPSGSMRALFTLGRMSLPHEIMKKVDGKVKDIQRKEEGGKITYTGTLTEEGAEAVSGGARFGRTRGESREGAPALKRSGTILVVASTGGSVEKIEITTQTSGSFGGQEFKRIQTTSMNLSDFGKVEIEIPKEAMAKFNW